MHAVLSARARNRGLMPSIRKNISTNRSFFSCENYFFFFRFSVVSFYMYVSIYADKIRNRNHRFDTSRRAFGPPASHTQHNNNNNIILLLHGHKIE